MPWALIAMATAELAWFADDEVLAGRLWTELHQWAGVGLSVFGVTYFGAADASLGILADVMGRHDLAVHLLKSAVAQEQRRGAVAWERRANDLCCAVEGDRRHSLVR